MKGEGEDDFKAFAAAAIHSRGGKFPAVGDLLRCPEHVVIADHMKRRAIPRAGLRVAPEPEHAKNRLGAWRKAGGAADAPDRVVIPFLHLAGRGDHPVARFGEPLPASESVEIRLEPVGDFKQVARVVVRVFDHFGRKWPDCPVGFLRGLGEFDAEELLYQRGKAEAGFSDQSRRYHGVEKINGLEISRSPQQSQIIVRPVKNKTPGADDIQ